MAKKFMGPAVTGVAKDMTGVNHASVGKQSVPKPRMVKIPSKIISSQLGANPTLKMFIGAEEDSAASYFKSGALRSVSRGPVGGSDGKSQSQF